MLEYIDINIINPRKKQLLKYAKGGITFVDVQPVPHNSSTSGCFTTSPAKEL